MVIDVSVGAIVTICVTLIVITAINAYFRINKNR